MILRLFDNSSLQDFRDCPERYRLKYILGLKKREEGYESVDKVWGKAIHAGLETLYKGNREIEKAVGVYRDSLGIMSTSEDKVKNLENGEKLLQAYATHYEQEDKAWEVLEVEEPHTFDLNDFQFIVKKDMVVKLQGNIFVVEHKTTKKSLGWDYWARFEPNSQITAQVYSTMLKYGQCSGVIVNALKVGFRERAYKGEPPGFHCEFQRNVFNRNKEQVEVWKEQTISWLTSLDAKLPKVASLRSAPLSEAWLRNEGACMFCSFKEICNTLGDESVVESLYEVVNPWEYLETKENNK